MPCGLVRHHYYKLLLKELMLQDHRTQPSLLLAATQPPLIKRYWWMRKWEKQHRYKLSKFCCQSSFCVRHLDLPSLYRQGNFEGCAKCFLLFLCWINSCKNWSNSAVLIPGFLCVLSVFRGLCW